MIKIINYGLGNIQAFVNVFERLNISVGFVNTPNDFNNATKLILPGVGSFDYAMNLLNNSGLRENLENQVLVKKVPILGVCVGMQMLANISEEGVVPGLGWIDGKVKLLNTQNIHQKTKLPHMGWNTINIIQHKLLFDQFNPNPQFYFLHSFYFEANNKDSIIAETTFGDTFTCAINKENIFGVQFHPEKSHENGINLLQNFANII